MSESSLPLIDPSNQNILPDLPTARPDGQPVILILSRSEAEALGSVFDSADRGREDFDYLVSQNAGDYGPEDVEEAHAWHERERALAKRLMNVVQAQTTPVQYWITPNDTVPGTAYRWGPYPHPEPATAALVKHQLDPATHHLEPSYVQDATPHVFLDLSTSVVTEREMSEIEGAPPRVILHTYGAWVHVPPVDGEYDPLADPQDDDADTYTWADFPNLRQVLIEARKRGAGWINLDGDADDILADLPHFDW